LREDSFLRDCGNLWDFQCGDFNAKITLFESSRQYGLFSLMLFMIQNQFVHLSICSVMMINNNVCSSVCLLAFSFQFECAFEWDCACDFLFTCDWFIAFLVFSDFWSRTSSTTFVMIAVKLLQMQWLFWYAMLLVLINCWVRVVSVSSVFSFSAFDNDFKIIMITITIVLLLRLRLFVGAFFQIWVIPDQPELHSE